MAFFFLVAPMGVVTVFLRLFGGSSDFSIAESIEKEEGDSNDQHRDDGLEF